MSALRDERFVAWAGLALGFLALLAAIGSCQRAGEANGTAVEANAVAERANELATDGNEIAQEANEIARDARDSAAEANALAELDLRPVVDLHHSAVTTADHSATQEIWADFDDEVQDVQLEVVWVFFRNEDGSRSTITSEPIPQRLDLAPDAPSFQHRWSISLPAEATRMALWLGHEDPGAQYGHAVWAGLSYTDRAGTSETRWYVIGDTEQRARYDPEHNPIGEYLLDGTGGRIPAGAFATSFDIAAEPWDRDVVCPAEMLAEFAGANALPEWMHLHAPSFGAWEPSDAWVERCAS